MTDYAGIRQVHKHSNYLHTWPVWRLTGWQLVSQKHGVALCHMALPIPPYAGRNHFLKTTHQTLHYILRKYTHLLRVFWQEYHDLSLSKYRAKMHNKIIITKLQTGNFWDKFLPDKFLRTWWQFFVRTPVPSIRATPSIQRPSHHGNDHMMSITSR